MFDTDLDRMLPVRNAPGIDATIGHHPRNGIAAQIDVRGLGHFSSHPGRSGRPPLHT